VLVAKIVAPNPSQMILVQRNDVVEQFATRAAHPSFGDTVGYP
jgi:hypothetical protein